MTEEKKMENNTAGPAEQKPETQSAPDRMEDTESYTVEDKTAGKKKKKFSEMESRYVTDFYKTNREVTKGDRARWAKEKEERKAKGESGKAPWTKREIIMVLVCVVLAALIAVRYFVLQK